MNRIETIESVHGLSEYGEAFIDFLLDQKLTGLTDIDEIISVCRKIERDFGGVKRKTGEDYVAHLYEVTRLYITLHGEKISQKRIIIALLHDNIEDISVNEYQNIKKLYGEEIAFSVMILSKEKLQKGISKDARNQTYAKNFESLSTLKKYIKKKGKEYGYKMSKNNLRDLTFMLAAIKISDRSHNLITLDLNYFSVEQIEKKMKETEDYIIPLAQSMDNIFLVDILRKELIKLSMKLNKRKSEEVLKGPKV